jgi:phosphatidylserine/phosphatidylglycerophosphate/cardiolipin synthase-like enzyme
VSILDESALTDAVFARTRSIAEVIESLVGAATATIDAALHRFNSQRLARALADARQRGVRIRLLTDRRKFDKSEATQKLLANYQIPFRLTYGRDGSESKMHHKFTLFDDRLVITGSYNWTFASEELNHENILLLREPKLVESFRNEFDSLWKTSEEFEPTRKK